MYSLVINAVLLGFALAMDAFSVSLANGLSEPDMNKRKRVLIAGLFGLFQAVMPLIGWFCVHALVEKFLVLQRFIPWIALFLLLYIGIKMLIEAFKQDELKSVSLSIGDLFLQAVATSIDALSVGFTISDYGFSKALLASLIIGVVTFIICYFGLYAGLKFGKRISNKASIAGGIILIIIGIEIFVKGVI